MSKSLVTITALIIRSILFCIKIILWLIVEPLLLLDKIIASFTLGVISRLTFIHGRRRTYTWASNLYLRGACALVILLIGFFVILSSSPTQSVTHRELTAVANQLHAETRTIKATQTAVKKTPLEIKDDANKKTLSLRSLPPLLSSASKIARIKNKAESAKREKESFADLFSSGKFVNISSGNPVMKEISITFDGGFEANHALEILRVLKDKKIKTTFFITGMFILNYPDIVKAILRDGHEIANHTMDHPHLTDYADTRRQVTLKNITRKFIADELRSTAALYRELTGEEISVFWRAPFGEINRQISRWAYEEGFIHVGWTMDYNSRKNLDSLDWVSDVNSRYYLSPEEIKDKIMDFDNFSTGLGGGIILMHLGSSRDKDRAVQVLASLIDEIRARNYRFVKVSRLARSRLNPKAVLATAS